MPKEFETAPIEGSSLEAALSRGHAFIVDRRFAIKLTRLSRVSTPQGKIVFPNLNVVAPIDHPVSLIKDGERKHLWPHVQYEFGTVEANMRPDVTGIHIGSYGVEMEKYGREYLFTVKSPHPNIKIRFKYNDEHTFNIRQGLINHHRSMRGLLIPGVPQNLARQE